MKRAQLLMSIFALLCPVSTQRADDIPKRFNFDRYSAMLNRSPFAVATAVALPVAGADFAKDLYVGNAARSPEGDMVTIASTADTNFKEYLTTKGPVDGYGIASIEWSDRAAHPSSPWGQCAPALETGADPHLANPAAAPARRDSAKSAGEPGSERSAARASWHVIVIGRGARPQSPQISVPAPGLRLGPAE